MGADSDDDAGPRPGAHDTDGAGDVGVGDVGVGDVGVGDVGVGGGAIDGRRARLLAMLDGDGGFEPGLPSSRASTRPGAAGAVAGAVAGPGPRGLLGLRERLDRVCALTASRVGVDGAGITVMGGVDSGRAGHRDQLAATGALTRRLEDLQLTAGEGPCLDAYASGMPVLAGDVAAETTRWLGFGPEALAVGAAALFSLPLQVGAVRLGTFDLHRATSGPLSGEQLADALALAALVTEVLLELAAAPDHPDTDPDTDPDTGPSSDLGAGQEPGLDAGWLPDVHAEVHVASGMVSARHDIDVVTALLRIRAAAFASGEPIRDLARRIIDHDALVPDDDLHHRGPRDLDTGTDTGTGTGTAQDGPPAPGPSPDSPPDSSPENDD